MRDSYTNGTAKSNEPSRGGLRVRLIFSLIGIREREYIEFTIHDTEENKNMLNNLQRSFQKLIRCDYVLLIGNSVIDMQQCACVSIGCWTCEPPANILREEEVVSEFRTVICDANKLEFHKFNESASRC